jgi:uncharacterized repeat protein (TIGR01451 family)
VLIRRIATHVLAPAALVLFTSAVAQAQLVADLDITNVDSPDPVVAGNNLTYTITVSNAGPDPAASASLSDTLPAGTTFVSLVSPGGWSCTTPAVGAGGTISCSLASMNVGSAGFTLTVAVDVSVSGTVSNTASITSSTSDPAPGNNSATAVTTVNAPTITPIHDIQGPGASSPIVGNSVTTRGVVTGVAANGFFMQANDADVDADPATSEGIFVFTSAAPPAAAAFSARVQVTGTVTEFVPSSDPQDPPSTRLTSPTVAQIAPAGQVLPTAILLSPTFPDPNGPFDQLERLEHMRVSVTSLTVSGPSGGSLDEINATGSNDGRFYGVVTGVARPFREAGIQALDTAPSGTIPPIPRWDFNPERLRIDSAGLVGQSPLLVSSGDVVTALVGPMTYQSRAYALLPDGTSTPAITPATRTTTVTVAAGNEFTVASINLRRFFDTVDDPDDDVVMSPAGYDTRLAKTSIAIRDHLRSPDIIAVQEVEKLAILNDLAARISADGGPDYGTFLLGGSDPEGLDVGVLLKTTLVPGAVPRVSAESATQVHGSALWTDPADNSLKPLFDRPPVQIDALVNRTATVGVPIRVIVTDFAGLNGIDSNAPAGLTTVGNRVRSKRQAQAAALAAYIQTQQTLNPALPVLVIGSFNAFEMNDGFVDVVNTTAGIPPPDNQTVVSGDGVDLVTPDLGNLVNTVPAAERYSQVFEGNARNVDHALVSAALLAATTAGRIEHPRIAADYPEVHAADDTIAWRFSDRDPIVAYFASEDLSLTDVQVTKVAAPNPVVPGQNLTYTITVTNAGPDPAESVLLSDTLPIGTTFVSLVSPGGWSCATPAVGAGGIVSCVRASMSVGGAVFTLTVAVSPAAVGTVSNAATVSTTTTDANPGNDISLSDVAVDGAPTITNITDQTIAEDGATAALPFTIGDVGTPAASLVLSGSSSNPVIVPNANIVFGGSGANRTVTVTPAANGNGGPVVITVTVSDNTFSASDTFNLTVTPVNDAPTIDPIANQTVNENDVLGPLAIAIADIDDAVSALTISATSSNQALVANAGLALGGSGASRTMTITPLADQSGQTIITVTVSDGVTPTVISFTLTVNAVPPTPLTYFLAEGATGDFFDEDLLIANPNDTAAPVVVTFYPEGRSLLAEGRNLPARSGLRLSVDAFPGLAAAAASVQVRSEDGLPLAVERTQFWGAGSYGGHTETAVTGLAPQWYFAEGAEGYFSTFLLVANPLGAPADVTLTFLREGESPVTTTLQVAPFSRTTIPASSLPDLANRAFGIIVEATQPVMAERAMYFGTTATRPWTGGAAAAGATAPSATWYFAEGATGAFFDTFILLMNPDVGNDAHVTLRYLLDSGETIDVPKVVPARGRLTVSIESESDPRLQTAAMSVHITADRPIVAERSVYWQADEGAPGWSESHSSRGATVAGPRWALAEGRSGGALNFHTYVLLGNPGAQAATVNVEFLPDSGAPIVKAYNVPALSRFTVDVTAEAPELQNHSFTTLISTGGDVPIVVERSMYWDGAGITWSGGSNASATRLP